jgi:hypothetical protein
MTRRLPALLLVATLAAAACSPAPSAPTSPATASPQAATPEATTAVVPSVSILPSVAPTATPAPTPAIVAPVQPASGGRAIAHFQLAAGIGPNGTPVGLGNVFPSGTKVVYGLLGWQWADPGTEFKLRLFQGGRFVYEKSHVVVHDVATSQGGESEDGEGFVFQLQAQDGFPDDSYWVEVDYNGVPDEVVSFVVGQGSAGDEILGSGSVSGPVPYPDPSGVLVVTRVAALRQKLGADTDAVLAAAARVGEIHDLDGSGAVRDTPEKAVPEVQRLLRAGNWKYLLILGNDDTVPFVHVKNPNASSEKTALEGWQLPSDWLPSDDPYTDLDKDQYGVPDIPTARIPSSEDAQLLLTQLAEIVPPDGDAFALVNALRKSQATVVLGAIDTKVEVQLRYAPPADATSFAADPAARSARYLYVLLHGIGVITGAWATNTMDWKADSKDHPFDGEWLVKAADQAEVVTVDSNPTSEGVVQVNACYGAWTLDTIQEPQHKTAANSLALHYLKSGTRAFISSTHITWSPVLGPTDTPSGQTGYELLFWRGIAAGLAPIDAFFKAKQEIGKAIDVLVAAGAVDSAQITLKTLHEMVYFGRP